VGKKDKSERAGPISRHNHRPHYGMSHAAFLKGFDNEFFPTAVEFMVKRAKHLVSKTNL
jgi:hypothetical protein